ncbi:TonB family protein [uncultured Desulfosarcina sp.]|uniref:TonB family protein n=1 Tax=uncultured Desulfosarcina sp. TaxID=218289 RepID=UPI0029C988B0|nr:TonB family protein [uncultured Desulfosarcina sp.]
MKKNVRVPKTFSQEQRRDGQMSVLKPVAVSFVGHLLFLLLFIVTPSLRFEKPPAPSVINVSMVSFKKTAKQADADAGASKKTLPAKKPEAVKPAKKPPVVKKTPEKTVKPAPKPKTSLKEKTFKSTQVVKRAIQELEAKVESKPVEKSQDAQPEPLQSALERLRKEVDKAESGQEKKTESGAGPVAGKAGGKKGGGDEGGKKTAEKIQLYQTEVAFQIQKQWAFNEQLAGGDGSLAAAIVFKVMPDGEIRDLFFTDRSGNAYFDDQAYKAVVKASPVDPHPAGLNQPYVQMGIRFTPQGLR